MIEVSYRPIIALGGRIPMIRDLSVGSTGDDVVQLQESLEGLGYAIYDRAGSFGSSTASALERLYRSLGYEVPTEERESVEPGGAEEDKPGGQRQYGGRTVPAAPLEVVVARKSELAVIADLPGTVSAIAARVGEPAGDSILTISLAPPTVQAMLAPSQRGLVRLGATVKLTSASPPFRSRARVDSIGNTIQDEATKAFSVPLMLQPRKQLPEGILEKGVEVRIDVDGTAKTGLIVPISAVYTGADGVTFVDKVVSGKTTSHEVEVLETGSGRARIRSVEPGSLELGDLVRIGIAD